MASDVEKFWDLVKTFDTAMVVTQDGAKLRARPMAPRFVEGRDEILFLTERASHKVEEVEAEHEVAITFSKHGEYLSVSGAAKVLGDRALVSRIWDASAEAWLPQGKDDPSVAVLAVDPSMAEIWDVKANKVRQAFEFAKAYLGDQERPHTTENRKIDL